MSAGDLPHWHETFSAAVDITTATISVRGHLEIFTIEYLRGEVNILRRLGIDHLTIDLANLTKLDLTAANYLAQLGNELHSRGGRLTLVNQHETISAVMREAGVQF